MTINNVEKLVTEYAQRNGMKIKSIYRINNEITAETVCFTTLEAKLTNKITFKVDEKRTSIYK